jgi:hypothetical protein
MAIRPGDTEFPLKGGQNHLADMSRALYGVTVNAKLHVSRIHQVDKELASNFLFYQT